MSAVAIASSNVKQVVPFLRVSHMERSVRYYVEGLGFSIINQWIVDGELRWCWLTLGGASIMLQEFPRQGLHSVGLDAKVGAGVSLCFQCEDALVLYHQSIARGLRASEPQVGNAMWVTTLDDPDGYHLDFESATAVPEETRLSELKV